MTKRLLFASVCFSFFISCSNSPKTATVDNPKKASYFLPAPVDWETETFKIPISFAPTIPYKGVETVVFTPGWKNKSSQEYWTYAFLWSMEGTHSFDAKTIETNLSDYYNGLIRSNLQQNAIAKDKIFPAESKFEKTTKEGQDNETFQGTIRLLDYMSIDSIQFNCKVRVRTCEGQTGTFVFHEISPKPFTDDVWKKIDSIWTGFTCDGK